MSVVACFASTSSCDDNQRDGDSQAYIGKGGITLRLSTLTINRQEGRH